MSRTIIMGGGIIGLSIAYELSKRGVAVTLLEKSQLGRATSWAGAGIFPPVNGETAIHPLEQLEALSHEIHPQWASELRLATGIDTGYSACGGIYLARTKGDIAALLGQQLYWDERKIEWAVLTDDELKKILPGRPTQHPVGYALFLPGESQLRNPRHLQALALAGKNNGVQIIENVAEIEIIVEGAETKFVRADGEQLFADCFCIAAGVWSESLLRPFGIALPSTPVRGQMALFKLPNQMFTPIINEGPRYLVPRDDGHVLAGATIEEVGFNTKTEPADIAELVAWASELFPACNQQTFVTAWAGLRPGTFDGFPYLGSIGRSENTWVATGHFKAGLHLSTGTAVVMADLIQGRTPPIDLRRFAPSRAELLADCD